MFGIEQPILKFIIFVIALYTPKLTLSLLMCNMGSEYISHGRQGFVLILIQWQIQGSLFG